MEVINEELRLKDEEYFNVNLEKLEKLALRGGDKKLKPEYVCIFCYQQNTICNAF